MLTIFYSTHHWHTILTLVSVVSTVASIRKMSQYLRWHALSIKLMQFKQPNQILLWHGITQKPNHDRQILTVPSPITFQAKSWRFSISVSFPDLFKNTIFQYFNLGFFPSFFLPTRTQLMVSHFASLNLCSVAAGCSCLWVDACFYNHVSCSSSKYHVRLG